MNVCASYEGFTFLNILIVFIYLLYTCREAGLNYEIFTGSNGRAIVLNINGSSFCFFLKVGRV
jgi:hypothetical protein